MKTLTTGKASLLVLFTVLFASFALLFNVVSKVSAAVETTSPSPTPSHNDNDHHDNHDRDWSPSPTPTDPHDGNDCERHRGDHDWDDRCHRATPTPKGDCDDGNVNPDGFIIFGSDHRGGDKCPSPSPVQSPTPVPSPTPCVPPDSTWYQISPGSSICRQFQFGGPESAHQDNPGSPSTGTGGQVLGASTMAGTGTFEENLYASIMVLGGTITAFGIKKAFQRA